MYYYLNVHFQGQRVKQHVKEERKGSYPGGVSSDTFDLQMMSTIFAFQCISCELDRVDI